ncbi:hypothetical protein [Cytobacillus oceanisediminis]|uniref:hypothetical protein n=1 Tax=Cytobacillus oceanisediminis TaxID=665099 RepID=UPI0020415E8B|nr:hypothetical protein [Cytobacillus oceanisediminis]MCM3405470.1 hypothetical protein [Cytobacillus oceanisediminis]
MITCKYCGQELKFVGENEDENYFNCTFCEMVFPLSETSVDRKRIMSVPDSYDDNFYVPTKKLLERDTISLYHLLKDIRATWYKIKCLLENLKALENENSLSKPKETDTDIMKKLKNEFIDLSKRKFAVENIILERTGYLPPKITEDFLSEIVGQGMDASNKPMFVYIR